MKIEIIKKLRYCRLKCNLQTVKLLTLQKSCDIFYSVGHDMNSTVKGLNR